MNQTLSKSLPALMLSLALTGGSASALAAGPNRLSENSERERKATPVREVQASRRENLADSRDDHRDDRGQPRRREIQPTNRPAKPAAHRPANRPNTRLTSNLNHYDSYHPGTRVRVLPSNYYRSYVNQRPYYYYRGVFYEPSPYGYVVVGAPIGARVDMLPYGYVSYGMGGRRYYHVNSTYYVYNDRYREYVVVEKPAGSDKAIARSTEVATAAELYVYPKDGQSEEQRDQDRYECHRWAKSQTNFDPSLPDQSDTLAPDYRRAISACLEGRGYTVK